MKRINFVLLAVVLALVIGIPVITPTPVKAATVWEVNPGESIQDAINGANDYDIILIRPGTYDQRIVVNKPLTVEGDGNGPVIIQGPSLGNGYAVRVANTKDVTISNLTTKACRIGISLYKSTNITVVNNTSENNTQHGIGLEWSNENTIEGNTLTDNDDNGVYLEYSSYNNITRNEIFGNSNLANGVFLELASHNNDITRNEIFENSGYGIEIWGYQTDNNTISENEIYKNSQSGILVNWNPQHTVITGNYIHGNDYSGIILQQNAKSTEVYYNDVKNNGNYGIYAFGAHDSRIYNNNFVDNHKIHNLGAKQAYSYSSGNILFNLASPVGGNYWSDWTGPDNDGNGFVDYPYIIPYHPNPIYQEKDNLPWAKENGWKTIPAPGWDKGGKSGWEGSTPPGLDKKDKIPPGFEQGNKSYWD